MRIRNFIWVGVSLVGAAIVFDLVRQTSSGALSAKPVADDAIPVATEKVRREDVPVYLNGLGKVQALNTVTIRAQVDGKIVQVNFREGQNVRAGDLLLQIDPRPYQAVLNQAVAKQSQDQAQLDYAQKLLGRDTELFDKRVLDRQSLDLQQATAAQLEALVKADGAAVDNAKVQLDYTNITSPIDGRVGLRLVDQGNIVHANDQGGLAMITELQPISVVFTLPENDLHEINRRIAANPKNYSFAVVAMDQENSQALARGELGAVDNQIDDTTGTVKLKAVFQNRQLDLWPGQFVNVRLLVDTRRQALVVPSGAVNQGPNGDFVYVIRPDLTAEVRAVKVGTSEGGFTLIENGVAEGENVVIDGQYLLKSNARVRIKNPQRGKT
ncbi:MAG TPA: efflux RND transporter periplasmic adaptor subunit [Chthoniobacterales bacterium]|jgi:membrane fusion protein, multidrug efflux system|nr:efflux RND transporter periplasmic adaptor subunit [Chthoniobacterales bacterium]